MNKTELIKKTDEYIKSVISNRDSLKDLDEKIKNNKFDTQEKEKLHAEKKWIQFHLERIVRLIGILKYEEQKMICYRYFDKLTYEQIALKTGYSRYTIVRRINKNLLRLGRIMFGFEKEFYEEFYDGELLFK